MSLIHEEEAISKGMKLVPVWLPIVWALVAALFTSGATFATIKASDTNQDRRIERLEIARESDQEVLKKEIETLKTKVSETNERLARIEGYLKK